MDASKPLSESPLFELENYAQANSVDRRQNELAFTFDDFAVVIRRVVHGWDTTLRIEADGHVLYSKVKPTDKVKRFWEELHDIAYQMEEGARSNVIEEVENALGQHD